MRSSLTYNQQLIFGVVYVVLILIVLFDSQYHLSPLRYPFELGLRPWQNIEARAQSIASVPGNFVRTVMSSQKMIADLQIKNAELQVKVGEAENAKRENEILKKEVEKKDGVNDESFKTIVTARIISVGSLTYLDKGLVDKVQAGGLVTSQGILLGKVQKVDQFTSQVITFGQGSWQAVAQTQSGVKGVIIGKNNQVLFTQVSADEKIEDGDEIFTTGSVAENIPAGLYIGQVQQKMEKVGAPVQTAIVNQSISIESLPLVMIKMRE